MFAPFNEFGMLKNGRSCFTDTFGSVGFCLRAVITHLLYGCDVCSLFVFQKPMTNSRYHRRSRSADTWLEHRPEGTVETGTGVVSLSYRGRLNLFPVALNEASLVHFR